MTISPQGGQSAEPPKIPNMAGHGVDNFPEFEGELARDRLVSALKFDLLGPEDPARGAAAVAKDPATSWACSLQVALR